jgi:hypothetical protein
MSDDVTKRALALRLGLAIAAAMAGLGVYILVRLLVLDGAPLTGTREIDFAFAAFFFLRAGLQVRRWRQQRDYTSAAE